MSPVNQEEEEEEDDFYSRLFLESHQVKLATLGNTTSLDSISK